MVLYVFSNRRNRHNEYDGRVPPAEIDLTSTAKASIPLTAAEKTRASMGTDIGGTRTQGQYGFYWLFMSAAYDCS
jgi:hypothetical protein